MVLVILSLVTCISGCSKKTFNGYSANKLMIDDDALAEIVLQYGVNASYGLTTFYSSAESVNGTINTLSGVYSLYEINASQETEISFDLDINFKNIKLVAVNRETNQVTLIANEIENKQIALPISQGVTIIALVGNGGKGTIKIDNIVLDSELATIETVEDDFD